MIALKAYGDDSGDDQCIGVSLAVTTVQGWARFEPLWASLLDSNGLEWFHMTDFESFQGDYVTWSQEQHRKFISAAVEIIASAKPGIAWFSRAMLHKDFEELPESVRQAARDPYDLCAAALLRDVRKFLDDQGGSEAKVDYVLDRRDGSLRVRDAFTLAARKNEEAARIGTIESASARQCRPLQVADIFAFEMKKEGLRQRGMLPQVKKTRWPCEQLMNRVYFQATTWDGEALRKAIEEAQ